MRRHIYTWWERCGEFFYGALTLVTVYRSTRNIWFGIVQIDCITQLHAVKLLKCFLGAQGWQIVLECTSILPLKFPSCASQNHQQLKFNWEHPQNNWNITDYNQCPQYIITYIIYTPRIVISFQLFFMSTLGFYIIITIMKQLALLIYVHVYTCMLQLDVWKHWNAC